MKTSNEAIINIIIIVEIVIFWLIFFLLLRITIKPPLIATSFPTSPDNGKTKERNLVAHYNTKHMRHEELNEKFVKFCSKDGKKMVIFKQEFHCLYIKRRKVIPWN